jgi:hypothetical protein
LCADDRYKAFGIYGMFMAFFHYSEYLTLAISNPKAVTLDSFMLFHSVQYGKIWPKARISRKRSHTNCIFQWLLPW